MLKRTVFVIVAAAAVAIGSAAVAQTASELLEKGIYTEETVGDLDAAIEIYERIVAEAKANLQFVAEAQFRLGKCLAKQGKKQDAERVFQELVERFKDSPAQKELVERARKLIPGQPALALEPVPWVDGEQLEMRIQLAGGLEIGAFSFSARAERADSRDVWILDSARNITLNAPNLGFSRVVADRETFEPIRSIFRHSLLGTVETEFMDGKAKVHTTAVDGQESDRTMDLSSVHYDNEQGWFVFRRLPLTEGYQGTIPIFTALGAGPLELEAEVTGKETVDTPAGTFDCYRLFLKTVQQTFWISDDSHRYVVKFEAGGVTGALQSIRQIKPGDTITLSDQELGFSISAPADWYFLPQKTPADSEKLFVVMDPDAEAVTFARIRALASLAEEDRESVRAWAEKQVAEAAKATRDQQVRPESWQEFEVGGLPAVRVVADFLLGDQKRSQYRVFVLGKSTAAAFSAHTIPEQLDHFRKKLDPIIGSYEEE